MGSSERTGAEPAVTLVGAAPARRVEVVAAPSNLGLRPPAPGREPGAGRAPGVLLRQGFAGGSTRSPSPRFRHPRTSSSGNPAPRSAMGWRSASTRCGSRMRSRRRWPHLGWRSSSVATAASCSVVFAGARRAGRIGLVHVDGHSDFRHPGNHDAGHRLGTAARHGSRAGHRPGRTPAQPLASCRPATGERRRRDSDRRPRSGDGRARLAAFGHHPIPRRGCPAGRAARVADRAIKRLRDRGLDRVWLHVDLDVLDQRSLPAVDSPGRPGFTWDHLSQLGSCLVGTGRVAGLTVTSYDPDLDPAVEYAPRVVDAIASALTTPAIGAAAT